MTHLRQLLDASPPAKQKAIVQHLTRAMQPVLEKALLHPPMTHRRAARGAGLGGCLALW